MKLFYLRLFVLKCPLIEAKFSNSFLKLIFWRKCVKLGCMIIEMKIRVMTFLFISITELEFQPIGFLVCHFFAILIQKLTLTFILTLFSWILDGLTENTVRFSIIKISIIFMHLWSKLTSEICQKKKVWAEKQSKTVSNYHLKLPPVFFKKPLYLLKNKKR